MVVDNVDTASATRTLKETMRDQHHAGVGEDIPTIERRSEKKKRKGKSN